MGRKRRSSPFTASQQMANLAAINNRDSQRAENFLRSFGKLLLIPGSLGEFNYRNADRAFPNPYIQNESGEVITNPASIDAGNYNRMFDIESQLRWNPFRNTDGSLDTGRNLALLNKDQPTVEQAEQPITGLPHGVLTEWNTDQEVFDPSTVVAGSQNLPAGSPGVTDKVDGFLSQQSAKDQWLADTANSPAAKANVFSPDERWNQHLKHQGWKKEMGRDFTHGEFL